MRTDLFQFGEFVLHAGGLSRFKICCENLSRDEIEGLAEMVASLAWEAFGPFGFVEGVPTGGIDLAVAVEKFATGNPHDPVLIVDDVFTTGASMEAKRAGREAVGVILFNRSIKPLPEWIRTVFTLNL